MIWIEVTEPSGERDWIQVEMIERMGAPDGKPKTDFLATAKSQLDMQSGKVRYIRETPDEVLALIEKARKEQS